MKQFSLQYMSSFCMSIHLAMRAGISVSEGVSMFEQEEPDSGRRAVIQGIHSVLELGESLSNGLKQSGAFPAYLIDMVEVGEKTGKLDETLLSLSRYYDRQEQMSKSIRSAVTYPLMLLGVLLLVLIIFIVKVLPIFHSVYTQLDARMSGLATLAMRGGMWLSRNWIPVVAVLAVIIVAAIVLRKPLGRLMKKIFMGGALGASMVCARFPALCR